MDSYWEVMRERYYREIEALKLEDEMARDEELYFYQQRPALDRLLDGLHGACVALGGIVFEALLWPVEDDDIPF